MISVVIPTYKNRKIFIHNLKHNLPFIKGYEIIVVNDDPAESIAPDIRRISTVELIENKTNLGFAGAVDTGIRKATHPYVMLLNSDVLLHDTSYEKAQERLKKDPKLFAVSFAQREKGGKIVGKNRIYWKGGFFSHESAPDMDTGFTAWAEGGACMLNTKIYKTIGGFDRLYSPYYWEDIDLSYRAWKNGYRIVFDRDILVDHHHESTISKYFNSSTIKTTAYRNQFIFIWKNITDKRLINSHIARVGKSLLPMLIKEPAYVKAFILALLRIAEVREKRVKARTDIGDQTIINNFALQR